MSTVSTPYNRIPGFYRQETVRKYAPSSSQCEPYDPEHLSMPRVYDCSRGNSSWYRLRPSRALAAEAALYRGEFVARFARSARLEEYQFHLAREKPHSLLFGQIFVREHRRAVSQAFALLFFSLLSSCSTPARRRLQTSSLPRPTHPRSLTPPRSPDTRRTAHTNSPPQGLILFAKVLAVKGR